MMTDSLIKSNKNEALLAINCLRTLSIDIVENANSGHPGLPLGASPMAFALWQYFLKHHPADPAWPDRDRFVLSAGHGSALLYSLLHLYGYAAMSMDQLKRFRKLGSLTPGHPEFGLTPGVEATTGPLGQGAANSIGMAIAERRLAKMFNRESLEIIDHYTYALVSDGDLMEGVVAEAASLAGHLKLGKLIWLYDSNDISLDGPTSITYTENVEQRFLAYGWKVQTVTDGDHDVAAIIHALKNARSDQGQPHLIIVKTTIGFGSPNKQGKSSSHGSPLGADEVKKTKAALGWNFDQTFTVPEQVLKTCADSVQRGERSYLEWQSRFKAWKAKHPELLELWEQKIDDAALKLPVFKKGEDFATRQASHKCLQVLGQALPHWLGGDADLSCSTLTWMDQGGEFCGQDPALAPLGQNIHYGVREHAMGAIANGICYHGGLRPYVATFFCFADYMRPAIRLAALNHLPAIFVFTHDSVGLGEDGPTHQPIEHLASLRAMPGLIVLRPSDANEVSECWRWIAKYTGGPVVMVLSRQKLPTLDRAEKIEIQKGYNIVKQGSIEPQIVFFATGSEVALACQVAEMYEEKKISVRVISLFSFELFRELSKKRDPKSKNLTLRQKLCPPDALCVTLEAGTSFGWREIAGDLGEIIAIDRFGISAPEKKVWEHFGFVKEKIKSVLDLRLRARIIKHGRVTMPKKRKTKKRKTAKKSTKRRKK